MRIKNASLNPKLDIREFLIVNELWINSWSPATAAYIIRVVVRIHYFVNGILPVASRQNISKK